jgi:hypothetical protein
MITVRTRWLLLSRVVALFTTFFIVFSVSYSFITAPVVKADNWAGWDIIHTIYYNPAQEDANNPFLKTAASDLQTYLGQMSGKTWDVVTTSPLPPAIYLLVNASQLAGYGNEAFHLVMDSNGVTITGKTAIACRWGAYYLLDEKLGVRWFKKGSAWTVVPSSLATLNNTNEIHEPTFVWRFPWWNTATGVADGASWAMHNKMYGEKDYDVYHDYAGILYYNTGMWTPTQNYWTAHPDYFLPKVSTVPDNWQLDPTNSTVQNWAINYMNASMSDSFGDTAQYPDKLTIGSVPVSPNDGVGWNPPYTSDQDITNIVANLAKTVANNIPNGMVSWYDYADYCMIPQLTLPSNVLSYVALNYNYSNLSNAERILGNINDGASVGVRDYINVMSWFGDVAGIQRDLVNHLTWLGANGVKYYNGESVDSWGGALGLNMYLIGKKLWDSTLDTESLITDFYNKAFGPAANDMRAYYENIGSSNISMQTMFNALNAAMTDASGNSSVLARIRQEICYAYFVWKSANIGIASLSQNDEQAFYIFLCKTRDWYIVDFNDGQGYSWEPTVRASLESRFGLSDAQVNALQDFTTPTNSQVNTWLSQGVAAFASCTDPLPINARLLNLVPLGDNGTVYSPMEANYHTIIIPSNGGETITVRVKVEAGCVAYLQWYNPENMETDYHEYTGPIDWTSVNFSAPEAGYYYLRVTRSQPAVSEKNWIDVPNRAAAEMVGNGNQIDLEKDGDTPTRIYNTTTQYFYVPAGTSKFAFCGDGAGSPYDLVGYLQEPGGTQHSFDFTNPDNSCTITSPASGLWKLVITSCNTYRWMWFTGIPALMWYSPQYLLVPIGSNASSQPAIKPDVNGDGVVNILDIIDIAQHWNETGPKGWIKEDVNNDGIINLLDISLVIHYWTK